MPTQLSFRIENGIRYLAPYWTSYRASAKGRWCGRTVVEVFQDEFLQYNPNYALAALRLGRILINGKQVTKIDQRIRGGDSIEHIHHKHEHPTLDKQIGIIADTDTMLVVNKPPSMPVHACGQYKVNTVLGLLWKLHGKSGLRPLHRLDRVTSGVLLFAKDLQTDIEAKRLIQTGHWKKAYVCKIKGKFPDGKQICDQPIDTLVLNLGVQQVREDGKECKSAFERVWYDPVSDESMVLCHIESGRTHQIRVHLQFLGYPIIGDNIYNTEAWGPERGKGAVYGKSKEQLIADIRQHHSYSHWHEYKDPDYDKRVLDVAQNEETQMEDWTSGDFKFTERPVIDPVCVFCHVQKRKPPPDHYLMPLHCWRYQTDKWSFTAELPGKFLILWNFSNLTSLGWAWPPPDNAEVIPGLVDDKGANPEKVFPIIESPEIEMIYE
ncbi:Pseudouridine synthase [Aphelenchoides bicaudatus]|nr:Pseudouridine synthase [Aphelenchoides bicaudatus]